MYTVLKYIQSMHSSNNYTRSLLVDDLEDERLALKQKDADERLALVQQLDMDEFDDAKEMNESPGQYSLHEVTRFIAIPIVHALKSVLNSTNSSNYGSWQEHAV